MYNDPNQPQQQPGQPTSGDPYGLTGDQPYYEQPPTQPAYPPPPYSPGGAQQTYEQQPYGIPPVPGYPAPEPQKKSRRWLWITLGIVGGILVLGCAACSLLFATIGPTFQQAFNTGFQSTTVAENYYLAIKNHNYTRAYSYLDTSGASVNGQQVTQDAFIAVAQAVDATKGPVTSYKYVTLTTDPNNPNASTVTMSVTRSGQTYNVHLQLKQVGNVWKITDADGI